MQLVPRTPRSREKLDPIATSSSGKSSEITDGTIYVPVSDIDEPDLAVMDRQSQMEVAKLRRIHRKHQLRDRKAGKPPYLYLYEPGVARGQPKNSGRLRTQQEKATLAKSRGDTHQLAQESTKLDVAGSSEGDQSRSHDKEDQGDRTMGEERSSRSLGLCETIKDEQLRTTMEPTEESGQKLVLNEESEKSRQNDVSYREPHRKDNTNARKHTLFPRSPPMPDKTVPGAVPTMVFSASKPPHGVFIPASSEARNRVQSQNITSPRKLRPVRSRPHSSRTAGDLDMYQIAGQHRPECNISGESEGLPKLISSRSDETPCVVRFMYLGATRLEEAAIGRTSEPGSRAARGQTGDWAQRTKRLITVSQQPSGTNTITVFKGVLQPGDVFEFTSRRVFGHPFSLSLCIDGTQDARISACCEYRHKCGMRIGGKYGHFVYLSVEGSVPCFKCQAAQSVRLEGEKLKKESRPSDLLTESGDSVEQHRENDELSSVNEQDSSNPSALLSPVERFGTNITRRIASSTRWEHFATGVTEELPYEMTDEQPEWLEEKLQLGSEESDEEAIQHYCQTQESISHLSMSTERECFRAYSMEFDNYREVTTEQEYYENIYEEEADEDDSVPEVEEGGEKSVDVSEDQVRDEVDDIGGGLESDYEAEHPVEATQGQENSEEEENGVIVEKVDAFYQHKMAAFSSAPTEVQNYVDSALPTNGIYENTVPLYETSSGDVHNITGCDLLITDVTEEAMLSYYAALEPMDPHNSSASGDSFTHAFSTTVHSAHPCARLSSVTMGFESEQLQSPTWYSKVDFIGGSVLMVPRCENEQTGYNVHKDLERCCQGVETSSISPCTNGTRSVTFTSAMSDAKSPDKRSVEATRQIKSVGPQFRLIGDDQRPPVTEELNALYSTHASPQIVRDRFNVLSAPEYNSAGFFTKIQDRTFDQPKMEWKEAVDETSNKRPAVPSVQNRTSSIDRAVEKSGASTGTPTAYRSKVVYRSKDSLAADHHGTTTPSANGFAEAIRSTRDTAFLTRKHTI
ncbi:hypothetical protein T265_05659 [Opisthorchis viverrini]|uniref:DUF4590 domain-containing protein n=1 Tax=Opisthorchis viverrini TaxID=6198 RepID=A0A074ZV64_OPIVI|nr:hypothetical protein T265_05659 [Opisthorchis viverrini]KER27255.1 hypothetical protein T265_05659 [Opisthorchis viverrini]